VNKELVKQLKADPDFRQTWVANISMAMMDAFDKTDDFIKISVLNEGAELFLNRLITDMEKKTKTFTLWVGHDVLKNDVILAYKTKELAELNVFPPAERIEIRRNIDE